MAAGCVCVDNVFDIEGSNKMCVKVKKPLFFNGKQRFYGPSGEIRTPGILNPNQAPYQLGHTRIINYSIRPFRNFHSNCGQISGHRTKGGSFIAQGKEVFA